MSLSDLLCLAGVGMIGAGLWVIHPAGALVFAGGLLTALGIKLHRDKPWKALEAARSEALQNRPEKQA